jgi:alpha-galactosidase
MKSIALFLLASILFFCVGFVWGDGVPTARWSNNTLTLDNGAVSRKIVYDPKRHVFQSVELKMPGDNYNFLGKGSGEFYCELNGDPYYGISGWDVSEVRPTTDSRGGQGGEVTLVSGDPKLAGLVLKIVYLLYPDLPIIRKKLVLSNCSEKEIEVESIDVEELHYPVSDHVDPYQIYTNYARRPRVGPYLGDSYDAVVAVQNVPLGNGLILGNEAPGPLKRTSIFLDGMSATIGLTHKEQKYPFRKWLQPGETWESTWSFLCPYRNSQNPEKVLSGPVADFQRRHLGLRLAELKHKPILLYDNWYPHGERISEPLIRDLAQAAAECGVTDFLVDAGWYRNEFSPPKEGWGSACGDYLIDKEKFPNGLKPVFDHVRALGMRPGLWFSMASAGETSRAYREHPAWLVRNAKGEPSNLHTKQRTFATACLTTPWYDHIKAILLKYGKEYDLKYMKIDIAIALGCYRFDEENTGCFAAGHPHKDRAESLLMIYRRAWKLLDELNAELPDCFLDFTFETMGDYQLTDLDLTKHAHGNWFVNYQEPPPIGPLRWRNTAWWTAPAMPASSLIVSAAFADRPDADLSLMSLAGAIPNILGDPRQLAPPQKARFKQWSQWFAAMQRKHDFMMYRQDLEGFGEPREGSWDGFQRINSDTRSGGIVGVFRQAAKEEERNIFVDRLDPARRYEIRRGPEGAVIAKLFGKDLAEKGFSLKLEKQYDGAMFEVDRVE